jgi:hypothetical protein
VRSSDPKKQDQLCAKIVCDHTDALRDVGAWLGT